MDLLFNLCHSFALRALFARNPNTLVGRAGAERGLFGKSQPTVCKISVVTAAANISIKDYQYFYQG